jgi:hypothetical protein
VACGYTVLKKDLSVPMRQILEILKTEEAKGRRKYLRAGIENSASATVNMPYNSVFLNGVIKDISTVGFSALFEEDPEMTKKSLFQNIQVKLQSTILKVEGIVFGSRMEEFRKLYVILFTQRIDPSVRTRIRKYIQQIFQTQMDALLKQAGGK